MQPLHGTQQAAQDGFDQRALPWRLLRGRGACASEVPVHVPLGDLDLLANQRRELGRPRLAGGLPEDRQGCLQRVCQVARMGTGARHHLGVAVEHAI